MCLRKGGLLAAGALIEPKHDHDAKADCAEKDFWGNHHQAGDAQYNTSDFLQMATEIFEQRGTDSDNAEDGGHNREHDLERDAVLPQKQDWVIDEKERD